MVLLIIEIIFIDFLKTNFIILVFYIFWNFITRIILIWYFTLTFYPILSLLFPLRYFSSLLFLISFIWQTLLILLIASPQCLCFNVNICSLLSYDHATFFFYCLIIFRPTPRIPAWTNTNYVGCIKSVIFYPNLLLHTFFYTILWFEWPKSPCHCTSSLAFCISLLHYCTNQLTFQDAHLSIYLCQRLLKLPICL